MFVRQPQTSTQQLLFNQQIESLKTLVPAAVPLNNQNTQWEVGVNTTFGVCKFGVTLPNTFPQDPPSANMLVKCQHPWIGAGWKLITPKLSQWSPHSKLGIAVLEIVQEFQNHPPQPLVAQPGVAAAPAPGPAPAFNLMPPPASTPPSNSPAASPRPHLSDDVKKIDVQRFESFRKTLPIANFHHLLDSCSTAELEDALNFEFEFNLLFEKINGVSTVKSDIEKLQQEVEDSATSNLKQKTQVDQLIDQITTLKSQYDLKYNDYQQLLKRQQDVMQRFSLQRVTELLDAATQEADEISLKIKKQFDQEAIDDSEFCTQYVDARRLYHTRAAKLERLKLSAAI